MHVSEWLKAGGTHGWPGGRRDFGDLGLEKWRTLVCKSIRLVFLRRADCILCADVEAGGGGLQLDGVY